MSVVAIARKLVVTHRDLEAMAAFGAFREDMFYRLKGIVLRTPALAERVEDIPLLATLFLRRADQAARFTPDALAWLSARDCPATCASSAPWWRSLPPWPALASRSTRPCFAAWPASRRQRQRGSRTGGSVAAEPKVRLSAHRRIQRGAT